MASPSPVPPKRRAVKESACANSSNSLACCSAVIPMPVSDTANSIQFAPSATLRTRSATSPSLVNLQALLNRLSRICRSRMGSTVSCPTVSRPLAHARVLVLPGEVCRSVDDFNDQRQQSPPPRTELELARLDLGEIEHLVNETEEMGAGAVHALQWLGRLLGTETRRV